MPADFRRPKNTSEKIDARFLVDLTRTNLGQNPEPMRYKFTTYIRFNTLIRYLGMLSNNVSVKYIFPEHKENPFMKNNEARNIVRNLLNARKFIIAEVSYEANNFVVLLCTEQSGISRSNSFGMFK